MCSSGTRNRSRKFGVFLLSVLGFGCGVDDLTRPVSPPGKTVSVERLSSSASSWEIPRTRCSAAISVPYEVNVPLYADDAEKPEGLPRAAGCFESTRRKIAGKSPSGRT